MTIDKKIKGFKIEKKIHESERTLVFCALKLDEQKKVAIKIPNSEFPTPDQLSRIQYEYRVAELVAGNPGVITTYSLESIGNSVGIVMEDFGGRSLDTFGDTFKGNIKLFLDLAVKIADAVDQIHKKRIVHKNITPHNIVWNRSDGQLKVIDFGGCSILTQEQQTVASVNQWTRSLPYISPEQTGRMNRSLDYRSDFYSMGITFFELLTGQLPFQADDVLGWIHNHLANDTPDPRNILPEIPDTVAEIIVKLMAKNADDRYQRASSIVKDLDNCFQSLRCQGSVTAFKIGEQDISERFYAPQRLYGRNPAMHMLLDALERTGNGAAETIMVTGNPGIGKSALIKEIQKTVVKKNGFFLEGKFDQIERQMPYRAFKKVFSNLVAILNSETPDKFANWRNRILDKLGPNGGILLEVLPELEQIIGEQPPAPVLNPVEAQNRFIFVIHEFLSEFAGPDHSLVIFLDDLQWCDRPSLLLLENLITGKISNCLIIGAYRSNEVDETHPLHICLGEIEKNQPIESIKLHPLGEPLIAEMISDRMSCPASESLELSILLHKKTNGNPFFLNELLKNLHQKGSIYFDERNNRWQWDLQKILQEDISDNVVTLMIRQLEQLETETKTAIQLAACIGNTFDLKTLSIICEQSPVIVNRKLWIALEQGVIFPLNDYYQRVEDQQCHHLVQFSFQHDRVQQAAYSMIEEARRPSVHYSIGKLMLAQLEGEELENNIMDVVRHLNHGIELIKAKDEKVNLAELNLRAGRKATFSVAYSTALSFFETGSRLLTENSWQIHYDLQFNLEKERILCLYLNNEYELANELSKRALDQVQTNLHKAEIYHLQLVQLSAAGELATAIRMGLKGLALLGIEMSLDTSRKTILKELLKSKIYLRGRKIADLIDLPEMKEERILLIMRLLVELSGPIYTINNKNLFALIVLKQVNISLKNGLSTESAYAFTIYGLLLNSSGRFKEGYQFGQAGIEINERFSDFKLRCRTLFMYTNFIHIWNNHLKTTREIFNRAMESGFQSGDLLYLGYAASQVTNVDARLNLPQLIEDGNRQIAVIKAIKLQAIYYYAIPHQLFRLNQAGLTKNRLTLSTDTFNEDELLTFMTENELHAPCSVYWLRKLMVYVSFDESQKAIECVPVLRDYSAVYLSSLTQMEVTFFSFLAYIDIYPQLTEKEQRTAKQQIKTYYKQVKKWAKHCEVNFRHWQLIMEAEMARLFAPASDTAGLYNAAIDAAIENDYLRYQAMANERAAKFFFDAGNDSFALVYLIEAINCYQRWGAKAKVDFLEEKYFQLLNRNPERLALLRGNSQASANPRTDRGLDFGTVIKASLAISQEIILDDLLNALMKIVIENAGAQKGYLILNKDETLVVVATCEIGWTKAVIYPSLPIDTEGDDGFPLLPVAPIYYVSRTSEPLVLENASLDSRFNTDPYINQFLPKSILCHPILYQTKLTGILYLENKLSPGVFDENRLNILSFLATQAAVSIENATLYTSLEESERKYRQIFEYAVEGIFQTTPDGKFIDANPSLAKMLGYASPLDLKSNVTDLEKQLYVKASDREIFANALSENGQITGYETQFYRKNGSRLWTVISARAIYDANGDVERFEGIIEDVTERKQKEKAEQERKAAEAAREAQSQFLANISHELRTPLQGILGFSKLGALKIEKITKDKLLEYFNEITASGRRLLVLLNDLLDLSQMESGKIDYRFEVIDMARIVKNAGKEFVPVADEKDIRILFDIPKDTCFASIDEERIMQVTRNLVSNAVKFSSTGDLITLSCKKIRRSVVISVKDQGVGIPETEAESIFDKFVQSSKTRTGAGGTGLGLAICFDIIKAHNGRIWAKNNSDGGAIFSFELPSF